MKTEMHLRLDQIRIKSITRKGRLYLWVADQTWLPECVMNIALRCVMLIPKWVNKI